MFKTVLVAFVLTFAFVAGAPSTTVAQSDNSQTLTDEEIRQVLIRQSIARYSGNCTCPYRSLFYLLINRLTRLTRLRGCNYRCFGKSESMPDQTQPTCSSAMRFPSPLPQAQK